MQRRPRWPGGWGRWRPRDLDWRIAAGSLAGCVFSLTASTLAFVPWEGGQATTVICENVHRVKGLEFDYVVLAASEADNVTDALLYVGASRAITGLTLVGPKAIAARLGLAE